MINAHIVMKGVPRSLPQQIVDLPSLAYYSTGGLKKSGICFMISISVKLNTNLLDIYLILKVGSIDLSGVQKHFCTISGSRGKSKTILDNRFQELEIINNLISLNLIPS